MGLNAQLGGGAKPAIVIDVGRCLAVRIPTHPGRADVFVVPGLDPEDLAELARADDLDGLLKMGRGTLLGADGHDLVVLAGRGDHRLALGHIVPDRLFHVDVLAGHHRLDRRQGVPVVGSRNNDRVDILAIEHGTVVACGIGRVSFCFLDPFRGLAGVPIIDVGNRDELHIGLRKERVEELSSPTACADDTQPDLSIRGSRPANGGSTQHRRCPG